MINVTGTYNEGNWAYNNHAETIEEAIKMDYEFWCKHKEELKFNYEGVTLKRLDNDCSFDKEISYLKEQIDKIDENNIERYKYEN